MRLFAIDRLVSAIVVSGLLAYSATGLAATLLHYDFSDGAGSSVTDLSGNGNDGTLTGFTDTSAGVGSIGASEGWVTGGGLSFLDDDVRSIVETPLALNALYDAGAGQTMDFTVEYQANYSGASSWTPAVGSDPSSFGGGTNTIFLGIHNNQADNEVRLPGDGGGGIRAHPWSAPDTDIHHIAMTFDAATEEAEVFVDSVSVGTAVRAGSSMNSESLFIIGNTGWAASEQWGGILYGVAISDAKLDPTSFVLPEPSTLTLLLFGGLASLAALRWRNR